MALNEYGDGFWCIHLDCCTATAANLLLQRTLSEPRAHYCEVKMVKYRSLLAVLGSLLAVSASSSPERLYLHNAHLWFKYFLLLDKGVGNMSAAVFRLLFSDRRTSHLLGKMY